MDIQWEEPPEAARRAGSRPGKYTDFATALKQNQGKWAKVPNEEKRRANSAVGLAQNIRRGKVSGFAGGRWETATQEGDVWACYVGPTEDEGDEEPTPRSRGRRRPDPEPPPEVTPILGSAIRAWAKAQGIDVPERGRLPDAVVEAYRAAQ